LRRKNPEHRLYVTEFGSNEAALIVLKFISNVFLSGIPESAGIIFVRQFLGGT
jgi:hypothetical protein